MKKLLLAFFLFISIMSTASAPPVGTLYIPEEKPIICISCNGYLPLVNAIGKFETGNCDTVVNRSFIPHTLEREMSTGRLQIRPCRVNHFNKLTGKNYTINDMCNFEKAKEVFLYFTNHDGAGKRISPKSWERAAKDWNGSGPKTNTYWENVKKLI
jgi:hypothetical protein